MKCGTCLYEVDEGDKFCRNCGAPLTPDARATADSPPAADSATVADLASEYAAALADTPEDTSSQYNLGLALLYQGRVREAAANFAAVVEKEPEFVDAYERLALALSRLGDTSGAINALKQAIELDPDNDRIRAGLDRLCRP